MGKYKRIATIIEKLNETEKQLETISNELYDVNGLEESANALRLSLDTLNLSRALERKYGN